MATLNTLTGNITAHCINCEGSKSSFVWKDERGQQFGSISNKIVNNSFDSYDCIISHRLFRCSNCEYGALAVILSPNHQVYPYERNLLISFQPETINSLKLPNAVPHGIKSEYREAEKALSHGCNRGSAGLFRSVLDKTMKDNGYNDGSLYNKIEAAYNDGIITESRKKRAHEEIRVLGNDVLHEEWCKIEPSDVEAAQHYCQRILEDFYGDRELVQNQLKVKGRIK